MNKIKKYILKIENFLVNIPHDFLLHIIAGMIIVSYISNIFIETKYYSIVFAIIGGILKEIIDYIREKIWSNKDIMWTTIGGLIIYLPNII